MPAQKWNREQIEEQIRGWVARGIPADKLWKQDPRLCSAARHHFGSWKKALKAAGVKSTRQKWTRHSIIREIRAAHRRGVALSANLAAAARWRFGSVREAKLAAGVPARNQSPPRFRWDADKVKSEIRARHEAGGEAALRTVWKSDRALYNAAKLHLGSWEAGAKAAGLEGRVKLKTESKHYSRLQTLQALRDWRAEGRPLANVERESGALYRAARRHFGSWVAAQRAAGFQPRYNRWSQATILEAIAERIQNGSSLSSAHPSNVNLAYAARRYYGSWKTAVQEARSKDGSNMRRAS